MTMTHNTASLNPTLATLKMALKVAPGGHAFAVSNVKLKVMTVERGVLVTVHG